MRYYINNDYGHNVSYRNKNNNNNHDNSNNNDCHHNTKQ